MTWLTKALYPIFGLIVLASYGHFVRRGIEPMEVSSDERKIPTGPKTVRGTTARHRHHTMIWFGGFGGK